MDYEADSARQFSCDLLWRGSGKGGDFGLPGGEMILEQLQAAVLSAIAARDELVMEFQEKRKQLGQARPTYKQEYAKAILLHLDGKNAEERKARAELATSDSLFRYELIEAECDGLKAAISAKADEISALQTLIRSHMDEAKALHYGQHDQV